jgi:hypothetical protein
MVSLDGMTSYFGLRSIRDLIISARISATRTSASYGASEIENSLSTKNDSDTALSGLRMLPLVSPNQLRRLLEFLVG